MAALTLAIASLGLTGLGFCLAWRLDSTQGFHGVMNLFLIPMWLLSGSLFPAATAPAWLGWIIRLNPMTYAVLALQQALSPLSAASAGIPSLEFCLAALSAYAAAALALSSWSARN